jgi:hypothetical protein
MLNLTTARDIEMTLYSLQVLNFKTSLIFALVFEMHFHAIPGALLIFCLLTELEKRLI